MELREFDLPFKKNQEVGGAGQSLNQKSEK